MKVENFSPFNKIKSLLTGAPGTEAVFGLAMPPKLSLFEPNSPLTASVVAARADHGAMVAEFEKHGIRTFNMRTIIATEIARRNKSGVQTLDQLRHELARRIGMLHRIYQLGDLNRLYGELDEIIATDARGMKEKEAVAINAILTNVIDVQGNELAFNAAKPPAANFLFMRDPIHIVGNTVVTNRMFYPIRQQEIELAKLGLNTLEIDYQELAPSGESCSLEGGDVLIVELNDRRYALLGQAERTSAQAVNRWYELHEKSFSPTGEGIIPAVIKGPCQNTQTEMHLDTYMQQVGQGMTIYCSEVADNRTISFLTRQGGEIVQMSPQVFSSWLQDNSNAHNMTRQEQLNYAPNVLFDGYNNRVFMTRSDSPNVAQFIRSCGVEVVLMQLQDLTQFYGGAHCATQYIRSNL